MESDLVVLLRIANEKKSIYTKAKADVDIAHHQFAESRASPLLDVLRTNLDEATRQLGRATAALHYHRQTSAFQEAQQKVLEKRQKAEAALTQRAPTRKWRTLETWKLPLDTNAASGPILTGTPLPPAPPADSIDSLKEGWQVLYEASPAFVLGGMTQVEKAALPLGSTVMLFTGLDHVVNKSAFRWGLTGIGFCLVLIALGLQLFVPEKNKAGLLKAAAVAESKLESQSAIALVETVTQINLDVGASQITGIYLLLLALILAYDPIMLAVVVPLASLAITLMQEGVETCRENVRKIQDSPGYDIASPSSKIAEDSAENIESAVQTRKYFPILLMLAAIVAAIVIGLMKRPSPDSEVTYGEIQAGQMLPAILSLTTGLSLIAQGASTAVEAIRWEAILDGELLKLERERTNWEAKEAEKDEACIEEEKRKAACEALHIQVQECSDAVKTAESEELTIFRQWQDSRQRCEASQRDYDNAARALAARVCR